MKKLSLFLILCIVGLFSYMPVFAMMSYNLGLVASYDVEIGAHYYRNDGMIKAINAVAINVTTLAGKGSITAYDANIQCSTYSFDGSVSCSQDCQIKADLFQGTGTVEGKKIVIACDEFKFQGAISCSQECIIYVKNAFDYTMFKRSGSGKYTVIITKNDVEYFSRKSLLDATQKNIINSCLSIAQEDIVAGIKQTRTRAALNRIDDKDILEQLKKDAATQAHYHKERLNEKRGASSDLYMGATFAGLGALGASGALAIFLHRGRIVEKFKLENSIAPIVGAALTGLAASASLGISYVSFSEWLNPQHKEKYEKLLLIGAEIDRSLQINRVPEEEIIILQ